MMELTMIRHTAVDVPAGLFYGFADVPLKSSFESEAATVRRQLEGKTFEKVYTSPLSRCTELASYCRYADAEREDRIREMNFGEWEMKSWMEVDKNEAQKWMSDWLNFVPPGGESFSMLKDRVFAFVDDLKKKAYGSVCLFTHGGVIRIINVYAGICPLEESFEFPVEYGQVFKVNL